MQRDVATSVHTLVFCANNEDDENDASRLDVDISLCTGDKKLTLPFNIRNAKIDVFNRYLYPIIFNSLMVGYHPPAGKKVILCGFPGQLDEQVCSDDNMWYLCNAFQMAGETEKGIRVINTVKIWPYVPISEFEITKDPLLYRRVFMIEQVVKSPDYCLGGELRICKELKELQLTPHVNSLPLASMLYVSSLFIDEHIIYMVRNEMFLAMCLLHTYERISKICMDGKTLLFRGFATVTLPGNMTIDVDMLYRSLHTYDRFANAKVKVMNEELAACFLYLLSRQKDALPFPKLFELLYSEVNMPRFRNLVMLSKSTIPDLRAGDAHDVYTDETLIASYLLPLCHLEGNFLCMARRIEWTLRRWKTIPLGGGEAVMVKDADYYPYAKTDTGKRIEIDHVVQQTPRPIDDTYYYRLLFTTFQKIRDKKRKVEVNL